MTVAVKIALSKLANTTLFNKELYFIGGTALAYHLHHRISEDVDIICPTKLPYRMIESTMLSIGAIKQKDIHESALRINGLNPSEYMLKFLLDDVKVEFFAASTQIMKDIVNKATVEKYEQTVIKMLDLKTIAKLKLLALLNRVKARDIYDANELIKAKILSLEDILTLSTEVKNLVTVQDFLNFITNMQERDDDEIVYINEESPVAISLEELQNTLIENIIKIYTK